MATEFESILQEIGGFGIYQKLMTGSLCLIFLPLGFFVFTPVFTYLTPQHRCYIPEIDKVASNATIDTAVLQAFIPYGGPGVDSELARCVRYSTALNVANESTTIDIWNRTLYVRTDISSTRERQTESCLDGWVYIDHLGRKSAVAEFNLVCEHAWKKPLLTSGLIVGLFIGSIFSGPLTDRFGRRTVCLSTLFGSVVSLIAFSLVPTYELLVFLIIVIGIDHIILYGCSFVLAQELVDTKHRAIVACSINVIYAIGYMLLPPVAYLISDWRWIIRFLGLASILFFPYFWFLPESPRWLISRGRNQDAYKLLKNIARVNKADGKILDDFETNNITVGEKLIATNDATPKARRDRRNSSIHILAKNSVMRKRSIILCSVWNVTFLCYYAFGFNTSNLGGNEYWNCFVAAALEIPCHFTVVFAIQKLGRRSTLASFLCLAGIFCGLSPVFDTVNSAAITFAMFGKFFAASTMGILYLYTSELYPTLLRSTGIGLASMSSRFGSIAAPFLVFAGENAGKDIPFYVMAALALVTSGVTLLLPETRQSSLPDSMVDAVNLEEFRLSHSCQKGNKRKGSQACLSQASNVSRDDEIMNRSEDDSTDIPV